MNQIASNRQYYPALDGLRGLAILMVVFFHNFGFTNYSTFGWLGVDLFFVLSGFLITEILLQSVGKSHFFKNFYIKRVLRIFPAYYLLLIICLIIIPHIDHLRNMSNYFVANQWYFWTFLQNWLFVFNSPASNEFLFYLWLWSLSVEEQFYIFWPLLIYLIKSPKRLALVMIFFLVFVISLRIWLWAAQFESIKYFSLYTYTRVDGICIGSLLALQRKIYPDLLTEKKALIVSFIAILNFVFFFFNRNNNFTLPYFAFIGYTTFAFLFAVLLDEVIRGNKIINTIFSNSGLMFFGKISYGFYLFHWPVYHIFNRRFTDFFGRNIDSNGSFPDLLSSLLCTIVGFFISVLSYYFFEKKFLNLKKQFL